MGHSRQQVSTQTTPENHGARQAPGLRISLRRQGRAAQHGSGNTSGEGSMLGVAVRNTEEALRSYFERLRCLLEEIPNDRLADVVNLILHARATGRRVYVVGNGGSAS